MVTKISNMSYLTTVQPLLKRASGLGRHYLWLWLVPTIAMTAGATIYALIRPISWRASQAIVVRDEASGNETRQGRFDSIDTMKTFQETVLEVARNRIVVAGALQQLGPPPNRLKAAWPSPEDVRKMQKQILVTAPQGAEFGRTEVIYLSVTGPTRDAAIQRAKAVCDQLEIHLGELRKTRAASVIGEFARSLELAQADLDLATESLEKIERQVGSDLGELRSLNDSGAGDSNLRRALNQVKVELRQARATVQDNLQLRELLNKAKRNPDELLATPGRLLESQPALRRLKEGLVDAQLRTASLLGRMSKDHPTVVAAIRGEQEVRTNLYDEVASALRGVEANLQAREHQLAELEQQERELQQRLDHLASLRARYSNHLNDLGQRTEIVQRATKSLAEARASRTAANSGSLLARFHDPVTGDQPVGPSQITIVASGLLGGLATGVGLVFLAVPLGPVGRRATDRMLGRRAQDQTSPVERRPQPEANPGRESDRRRDQRRSDDRDS